MKPFTTLAIVVFVLVAVAHLLRLIFGWEIAIDNFHLPMWVSVIGVLVPSVLACMIGRESRR